MPYTPFVSLVAPVRNAKKIARVHHGLACGAVVGVVVVRAMGEDEVGLVFAYLLRPISNSDIDIISRTYTQKISIRQIKTFSIGNRGRRGSIRKSARHTIGRSGSRCKTSFQ